MHKISQTILSVAIIVLTALPSLAYDFEKDGVYYRIIDITDKDNPTCAATPGNDVDGHWGIYAGDIVVPASVNYNGRDIAVVAIDEMTFMNSRDLNSVEIKAPIETVSRSAFFNAKNLKSVALPSTVKYIEGYAFAQCYSLTAIDLQEGLETLEAYAFSNCTSLESIKVPDTVIKMADGGFQGCTALTSVSLPQGMTRIPDAAFTGCTSLKSIAIPSSVTSISSRAFESTGLSAIELPQGLLSVGMQAFYDTPIKKLVFPDAVQHIGRMAIYQMPELEELVIGSGVVTMGNLNITECPALKKIVFKDNSTPLERISESYDNDGMFTNLTVDEIYVGRDNIQLNKLHVLKKIEFGPCVKTLTHFWLDKGGTFIIGPNTETISYDALAGTNVENISIPASVTKMENNCISGDVRTITFDDSDEPVELGITTGLDKYGHTTAGLFYLCKIDSAYVGRDLNYDLSGSRNAPFSQREISIDLVPKPHRMSFLEFGDKVTRIGDEFALGCSSLSTLKFGSNIRTIGQQAFEELRANKVDFPESLAAIGYAAFRYSQLRSAIITGDKLRSIGAQAFAKSTYLKNIALGGSLESIEANTFDGCKKLESIALPETTFGIAQGAFNECDEIKTLIVRSPIPPVAGTGTFSNKVKFNARLLVPAQAVDKYKSTAEWSDFWNISAFVPLETIESNKKSYDVSLGGYSYLWLTLEEMGVDLTFLPADASFKTLKWVSSDSKAIYIKDDDSDATIDAPIFVILKHDATVTLTGKSLDGSGTSVSFEVVIGNGSDIKEIEPDTAKVSLEGDMLTISGCAGQPVSVHNLTGHTLLYEPSLAATCGLRLPAPGIYIIRTGSTTHKILYSGN